MSVRIVALIVSLVGGPAVRGVSGQTPAVSGGEEAAIRTVIAATTEAFSRHDARAWSRLCTPDARLVTVRGESMQGREAIEKGLAAIFATRGRGVTLETLDVAVRFIRPDVALAHVTNRLSGLADANGQPQPPHTELSIRVFVKDGGEWRIAAFHNTIVRP
jgi:uncharacterized protein (TIGR02246 family)